jgi:ribosome-binding protein aMBF1 (putative translation factor)
MQTRQFRSFSDYLNERLQDPEFAEEYRKAKIEGDFALAMARLREARGLTQQDIEQKTGIKQETISRIERGRVPSVETLKKLADVLNARVSILPQERVIIEPLETASV